ncbi:ABC-type sugar transport system, periplasmic component [Mesotoga infera]|uniref:ABC-type sugar transport system, periplasmic component n=1 Tax=Mesotoga infera TaxID=1236046 RepID=A0A7Z7LF02_9BACT|nr:ABC-type sugar transport system, periplasmic component [Mesotoga infera]
MPDITPSYGGGTVWASPPLSENLRRNDGLELNIYLNEGGHYAIRLGYTVTGSSILPPEVSIEINGVYQFLEAQRVTLVQYWKYETLDFPLNRYGDEVLPSQTILPNPLDYTLRDSSSLFRQPLLFSLEKGENTVKLTLLSGEITLHSVEVLSLEEIPAYAKPGADRPKGDFITIVEAEHPSYKSDTTINAIANRSLDVVPFDTYRSLLNTFGGASWKNGGQAVFYEFEVPSDGYYCIAFKYIQDSKSKMRVFRKITIDGAVPYKELESYPFDSSTVWKIETLESDGENLELYLTAGRHTLGITVNVSVYESVLMTLKTMISQINDFALQIRYLTGGGNIDRNVEWEIEDYFPGIDETLAAMREELAREYSEASRINGNEDSQELTSFRTAIMLLERLMKAPDEIPKKLDLLVGSVGSIVSELSVALNGFQNMPLTLDRIYIYAGETAPSFKRASIFASLWEGIKRFVDSFKPARYKAGGSDGSVVLEVWINRARQYSDIIQQLVDDDFTPRTGIVVDLSIIKDEQKLILANAAGKSPDIALGISNWIPFEMGIRGAALALSDFEDFTIFARNFMPGTFLPFMYEGKVYGLPETQDFYLTFYRKDVLGMLNIPVPSTWEEVKLILPELHRNGLNYYIPIGGTASSKAFMTTAPFFFQHHARLYSEDGLSTAIDRKEGLEAIREMTDLFAIYGMPLQVSSFFEHFRKADIPIGISNLATYVQLMIAAPELKGLWGLAPSPGVAHGDIERWQTGSAQAVAIFGDTAHPQEAWQFLKWWLSKETQSRFVFQVLSTYGLEYLILPSNRFAFEDVPLPHEDKEAIREQWEWLQEVPRSPATYILEREISNIWNRVVLEGRPIRVAVDDAVQRINREILRKMEEFGYVVNGRKVREYEIPDLEKILAWWSE